MLLSIGLYLSLRSTVYDNNSIIFFSNIGESFIRDTSPRIHLTPPHSLQCITDKKYCCSTLPWRAGEWYFPNASNVPILGAAYTFYRTRGDDGSVNLNRRDDHASVETGLFCCMLPDAMGNYQTLCANIGKTF